MRRLLLSTNNDNIPPNNEIWYATLSGKPIVTNGNNSGVNIISNSIKGKGVLVFDGDIYIIKEIFTANFALKQIIIPNGVALIGDHAFDSCTFLNRITIDKDSNLESIGYAAFADCESLTSIFIPKNVSDIGDAAFANCVSLNLIQYGGTMEQWKNVYVGNNWIDNVPTNTIICTDGQININN